MLSSHILALARLQLLTEKKEKEKTHIHTHTQKQKKKSVGVRRALNLFIMWALTWKQIRGILIGEKEGKMHDNFNSVM